MGTFLIISQLMGGVALFLYGANFLSSTIEKIAGAKIQELLGKFTGSRLKAAIFGFGATAILQSSSLMMVTMVGLINSGLMTLEQSVGVMLGQEIGTTFTAQLIAFNLGSFCFLLIAIGVVLSLILEKWKNIGDIFLSVGILFLGMVTMSSGAKLLEGQRFFSLFLFLIKKHVFLGILVGTIGTAIIQSSAAFIGLVIGMGSVGMIDLMSAISLAFGANLGTCITGFLAALKLKAGSKQASVAQILINVFGILLFFPFLRPFSQIVGQTSSNLPRQIANAHTLFNVSVSLILFPFVAWIVALSRKIVPAKAEEKITFLDDRILNIPGLAIKEALGKTVFVGNMVGKMLDYSKKGLLKGNLKAAKEVLVMEDKEIDKTCNLIETYIDGIMERKLNDEMTRACIQLIHNVTDIERVADLAYNLAEAAFEKHKKKINFSPQAKEELTNLFEKVSEGYRLAIKSLENRDENLARRMLSVEDEVDELEKRFRENHVKRLEKGICQPRTDVIFIESLQNLERISDQADNLAGSVLSRSYIT